MTSSGPADAVLPGFVKRMLHGRPMLKRVIGNSVWQVGDKIVRMGAGVVVSAYIARYLGPSDFGLLSFAVALMALFSAFAMFGLPSVVVRDLINRPHERRVILGSALLLRLLGGVLAIVLAVMGTVLLRLEEQRSLLLVFIIALSTLPQAWDVVDYDYQARIDARPIVVARNISFVAFALLRACLVLLRAPLVWFAWAIVGEAALAALLMARRSRAEGFGVELRSARWQEVRSLAVTGWPLVIAGLSVSVYMRVDQVMLGRMMGDAGVGLFSAAVRISEALYFLPIAVAASVAPALTATYGRSTEDYERGFVQVSRLLVWVAIAVALTFTVLSRPITLLLYGAQYLGAAPVLAIHAWAGVLVSLGVCGTLWLTNAGYLKYSMYQTLIGAAVNVALNLVMIPRLGAVGAALASVAGQFASVVLTTAALPKTRQLFRLQLTALRPALRLSPGSL